MDDSPVFQIAQAWWWLEGYQVAARECSSTSIRLLIIRKVMVLYTMVMMLWISYHGNIY